MIVVGIWYVRVRPRSAIRNDTYDLRAIPLNINAAAIIGLDSDQPVALVPPRYPVSKPVLHPAGDEEHLGTADASAKLVDAPSTSLDGGIKCIAQALRRMHDETFAMADRSYI